jgi:SAM-dependent methyltransferase
MINEYTRAWFEVFAKSIDETSTKAEVDGFTQWLPLPEYRRILDVCCGLGRHAAELSRLGYDVVGVDRDGDVIKTATLLAPDARFVQADQRTLEGVSGLFDAVLVLWQSFGYFDHDENDAVLKRLATVLRPGGRLLLDVYHPAFWRDHQGVREEPRAGVSSVTDTVYGDRLSSRIEYTDGAVEMMDFELIEPEDLAARAGNFGLTTMDQCCWWDPRRPPERTEARYQSIFQK